MRAFVFHPRNTRQTGIAKKYVRKIPIDEWIDGAIVLAKIVQALVIQPAGQGNKPRAEVGEFVAQRAFFKISGHGVEKGIGVCGN